MRRLTAVLAAALLGACTMVPDYQPPQAPTPRHWEAGGDAAAVWPDPAWWEGFGSRELDGFIRQAIADNRNLRAAVARIRQAQAQARIAGADLYPWLSAGGSGGRSKSASSRGETSLEASLAASYEVDLFGRAGADAAAAETRVEASIHDRQTVALTLLADVATTYFQVITARERRRLAEESLANTESILALLEERQRAGTISDLEVAQQRSAVASVRASLPALQLSERLSLNALAVLLGRPPEGFVLETRSLEDIRLPPIAAGLPSGLLERRPDLRRAEADLRAANFDVGAARAARFPSLVLTAEGGTVSGALSGLFASGSFFYALAASLAAPIFEGGRLQGQEELDRARFDELIEAYQQAILAAFQDVENALSTAEQNGRQYVFNREAYEQAREAFRLADLRFRVGTVDFLTVLEAQRSVFQTADALAQIDAARYNALVGVYRALGGGWDGRTAWPPR